MKDKVSILGKHADAATYQGLHNVGNELVADVSNIPATTYLAYDSYSNPTHIRNEKDKTETVYLYGYKGKYAIAGNQEQAITNQLQDCWGMILSKDWQTQRSPAIQTCRKLKI